MLLKVVAMVEYETILKLDKQLKAIEDQIQEMRRQLLPVKSPKKLQMIAARGMAVVNLQLCQ